MGLPPSARPRRAGAMASARNGSICYAGLTFMAPLTEWQTLVEVQAGASATLTGLVFVAASINLARIIEAPGLPPRAAVRPYSNGRMSNRTTSESR